MNFDTLNLGNMFFCFYLQTVILLLCKNIKLTHKYVIITVALTWNENSVRWTSSTHGFVIWYGKNINIWNNLNFNSPCQRQWELLPSLGICRPSYVVNFHINIFSSENRNFFNCPLLLYYKSKWAQIFLSTDLYRSCKLGIFW